MTSNTTEANPPEERILPATRRPDGTMRKPVRIRAGYVPQEEVAIYQSKGALFKKDAPLVPPGYDPETDLIKPKTKAAKKNEKRKEKKHQAKAAPGSEDVDAMTKQIDSLQVSSQAAAPKQNQPSPDPIVEKQQGEAETGGKSDIEKRIRALRKKIRLAKEPQQDSSSAQQNAEKMAKVETWERELKELESTKLL